MTTKSQQNCISAKITTTITTTSNELSKQNVLDVSQLFKQITLNFIKSLSAKIFLLFLIWHSFLSISFVLGKRNNSKYGMSESKWILYIRLSMTEISIEAAMDESATGWWNVIEIIHILCLVWSKEKTWKAIICHLF